MLNRERPELPYFLVASNMQRFNSLCDKLGLPNNDRSVTRPITQRDQTNTLPRDADVIIDDQESFKNSYGSMSGAGADLLQAVYMRIGSSGKVFDHIFEKLDWVNELGKLKGFYVSISFEWQATKKKDYKRYTVSLNELRGSWTVPGGMSDALLAVGTERHVSLLRSLGLTDPLTQRVPFPPERSLQDGTKRRRSNSTRDFRPQFGVPGPGDPISP